MKLTQTKLRQIIKEVIEEADVLDFSAYKRKKAKEHYRETFLVNVTRGNPAVYGLEDFNLVTVDSDEQAEALSDGDYEKALELGASFNEVLPRK